MADRQYQNGLYSEAISICDKILEINPFYSEAYSYKAWCYSRDNSLTLFERNLNILQNAKKALALEPDISDNYNTLCFYEEHPRSFGVLHIPEAVPY